MRKYLIALVFVLVMSTAAACNNAGVKAPDESSTTAIAPELVNSSGNEAAESKESSTSTALPTVKPAPPATAEQKPAAEKSEGTKTNTTAARNAAQPTAAVSTVVNKVGNTNGNILNRGLVASQGEWLYYSNSIDHHDYASNNKLTKVKKDGTGKKVLTDNHAQGINVIGEWVYYINMSDQGKIYKIGINGTGGKKVLDVSYVSELHVTGTQMYFKGGNNGALYKASTDGRDLVKLVDGTVRKVNISGNYIYYIADDEGLQLYRIGIDGSGNEKIKEIKAMDVVVSGDWIYYSEYIGETNIGNYQLCKIKRDGTGFVRLDTARTSRLNISGNYIYYAGSLWDDKGNILDDGIYRIPLKGIAKTKIASGKKISAELIFIADNYLYYQAMESNLLLRRIKITGSESMKFQ